MYPLLHSGRRWKWIPCMVFRVFWRSWIIYENVNTVSRYVNTEWPNGGRYDRYGRYGRHGRIITYVVTQLGKKSKHCSYILQEHNQLAPFSSKNFRWWLKKSIGDLGLNSFPAPLCAHGRFQVPDVRNLKPEMKYAMKMLTQFVMKLERKSLHFSTCQKKSRNFNDIVTSFDMKTNFTHESDGWKYGLRSKIWFDHHSNWAFFDEKGASWFCSCNTHYTIHSTQYRRARRTAPFKIRYCAVTSLKSKIRFSKSV